MQSRQSQRGQWTKRRHARLRLPAPDGAGALDLAADWNPAEHPRGPDGRFISRGGSILRNIPQMLAEPREGDVLRTPGTFGTHWTFKDGEWTTHGAPSHTPESFRAATGTTRLLGVTPEQIEARERAKVAAKEARLAAAKIREEREAAQKLALAARLKAAFAKRDEKRAAGLDVMPYPIEPRSFADVDWDSIPEETLHPQIPNARPTMEQYKRDMLRHLSNPLVAERYKESSMPLLKAIEENRVQTSTTIDAFRSILFDGEFKTGWEGVDATFGPPGVDVTFGYWQNRLSLERHIFGISEENHVDAPPIYGFVAGTKPGDQFYDYNPYGNVTVTFKKSIDGRTTVTFGDSLNSHIKPTPKVDITERSAQEIAESSPYYDRDDLRLIEQDVEYLTGNADPADDDLQTAYANQPPEDYVEAQVYGNVTLEDIDSVQMPEFYYNQLSGPELAQLEGLGITVNVT